MLFKLLSYLDLKLLLPLVKIVLVLVADLISQLEDTEYPKQTIVTDKQTYDFVVVGAGTAGCVIAHRLTETGNWSVLLIEAGGDPPRVSESPPLSVLALPYLPDWNYHSVNDGYSSQARRTKTIHNIRGKMLGGSSSLNYMYHVRGNKADYDEWAERGNLGWDWENIKEYLKKIEHVEGALRSGSRGLDGLVGVTMQASEQTTADYLKFFEETGHVVLADYNADQQMGYSNAQFTIANGIRQSAAEAYLKPAKNHRNLHVLKNTQARKVIFDSNKNVAGLEVSMPDGKIITVNTKEVILCAGAVNSPQLLMLSGVGPKDHLIEMGIEVIHDSDNVGQNLQDHPMVYVMLTGLGGFWSRVNFADIFRTFSKGEFPVPTLLGFAALDKAQSFPDYETTVCPLPAGHFMTLLMCRQILDLSDEICLEFATAGKKRETLNALVTLLRPESRGSVELKSRNPEDKAIIYNGYFSNSIDLDNFARYLKDYLSVANATSLRNVGSRPVDGGVKQCRQFKFGSNEYWKCYILNTCASQYHLAGTCAMGPEGEGVVDEMLRVRGVTGLRVVDASVIPTLPRGNINVPVLMIAEKAADMIKQDVK